MKIVFRWGPVVAWMSVIFFLSQRQHISVSDTQLVNFLVFKSLHLIEYGALFILSFRAFSLTYPKASKREIAQCAALLSFIYGLTDEIHQMFVPTREGKLRDGIIDGIGIILAWLTLIHILPRMPKKLVRLAATLHVSY